MKFYRPAQTCHYRALMPVSGRFALLLVICFSVEKLMKRLHLSLLGYTYRTGMGIAAKQRYDG